MADKFTQLETDAVCRATAQRRDIWHFIPGPVDDDVSLRLLTAAHQGPSV